MNRFPALYAAAMALVPGAFAETIAQRPKKLARELRAALPTDFTVTATESTVRIERKP